MSIARQNYDSEFWSSKIKSLKSFISQEENDFNTIDFSFEKDQSIPQEFKDFGQMIKNDSDCVDLLISFLENFKIIHSAQLFRFFLACRTDWVIFRIPSYQKLNRHNKQIKTYSNISILHLVLLIKPCKAFLKQIQFLKDSVDLIKQEDGEGNTTIYYAILSNNISVYKHIYKMHVKSNSDSSFESEFEGIQIQEQEQEYDALKPDLKTCVLFLKADETQTIKVIGIDPIIEKVGGVDACLSMCISYNSIWIIKQLIKSKPSLINQLIDKLLIDSQVNFFTFRDIYMFLILSKPIDLITEKYSIETIVKRAWDLAIGPCERKRIVSFFRTLGNNFFKIDLDLLVSYTGNGYTFGQLRLKYESKNISSKMNQLSSLNLSSINHISFKEGNYMTMVAKEIYNAREVFINSPMSSASLNYWYINRYLDIAEADWSVPDSEGITPLIYFSSCKFIFEYEVFMEIGYRCSKKN